MTSPATVLLPVYNAGPYLEECLDSLLAQTHSEFEILAIDDASQDETAQVLENYRKRDSRIRILTRPRNQGLISTLNLGLNSTESRYVFRQDADDRAHPERIARSLHFLKNHPDVLLLGTGIHRMDESGRYQETESFPTGDAEIRWQLLFRNPFAHPTVVFDRKKALSIGGYSETARHAEDYDLWVRLAQEGEVANLPEVLCDYRVHSNAISNRHRKEMETQSARIGANAFRSLFLASENTTILWKRFRSYEALSTHQIRDLTKTFLEKIRLDPRMPSDSKRAMTSFFSRELFRYFRRNPFLVLDPRNLPVLMTSLGDFH